MRMRSCGRRPTCRIAQEIGARVHVRSFVAFSISVTSPLPQPLHERRQVGRQRHLEVHRLAGDRMHKPQLDRTQGQTRCTARVGLAGAKQRLADRPSRRTADGRSRPDECESGAFGPFPGGIRSACSRRAARSGERASRRACPRWAGWCCRAGRRRDRGPVGFRWSAPRRRPATIARYRRRMLWTRNCCPRCFSASAVRAKTIRPLVSRSSRCTGRTPPHFAPFAPAASRALAISRGSNSSSVG